MKIKSNDYNTMKEIILKKFNPEDIKKHQIEYKNSQLSDIRFVWDVWRVSQNQDYTFTCDTLYKYLNDDHITTALKSVIKDITN